MEDERIVPALVSVYKAEVWHDLGFCGNVRPGTTARASPRFRRLPRPVWRAFARGMAGGRVAARLQLSLVLGVFCAVGAVFASRSRRFHAEHKYKLKNLWNPSWKVLRMYLFCFTFVLFSLRIQQALYFLLILSRCNFLFRSKCYDIVYYNCKLKLWTFKAGSKNIYGLFLYNPKSEKVGTVWKTQIKKESSDF